jgi:myo-inositol catabolism protein IolC
MPAYLAERLVQAGSIEPQPSGFSLRLLNRTRPAVLTAARDVRVDGALLRRADVLLETGSGRLPLGRPLELPLNRPLTLYVETGESLGRGEHEVEIDLTVEGVASGRVTLRGHVDSGERGAAG